MLCIVYHAWVWLRVSVFSLSRGMKPKAYRLSDKVKVP